MVKLSPLDELRLLVKVSKLYYEEGLSQDAIMARLSLSRSKVSRILQQARDEGIVQITVITPNHLYPVLENGLEKRFGLLEAVVVECQDDDSKDKVLHDLGLAAAGYLERSLSTGAQVGISWGSTLHSMVSALHSSPIPKSRVVQIIGGLGQPEAEIHAIDLCRRMARALGSELVLLPAPGIVASRQARQVMLEDPYVRRAIETFPDLDIAFVGVGAPEPESVLMRDGSILSSAEMNELLRLGAVGDIALRFFDCQGHPIESEIDHRVIGITFEQLHNIQRVVGVAGGPGKLEALRAALHGKLINVLITDSITAQALMQ